MKDVNNSRNDQSPDSQEILAAKLAFFGSVIATIGDGITALAAGIVLQGLENTNNQNSPEQSNQSRQLEQMQKQIDQLTSKLEKMERSKR